MEGMMAEISMREKLTPQPMGIEPVVTLAIGERLVDVDASIASIVAALNEAGAVTVACCSGHGVRPGNIALRDGRELVIARNYQEARLIDRLFTVGANGEPLALDGRGLRTMRKAAHMKASDLAAALDISPEHMSRLESGRRQVTRAMALAASVICAQSTNAIDAA
jgi:DNA-binding transcriptional regulator YiaG